MQSAAPNSNKAVFGGWEAEGVKVRNKRFCTPENLTPREAEVIVRKAAGQSHKEIARELHCSENNSKSITRNLLYKHHAKNAAELVCKLIDKKLLKRSGISAIAYGLLIDMAQTAGPMSTTLFSLKDQEH